jgi:hypothetical protein
MTGPVFAKVSRAETSASPQAPRYTIATLVTDRTQHAEMMASWRAGGFTDEITEYLFIDNTGSKQTSAYAGLNALLNAARAEKVILCHQDVRLERDGLAQLNKRLSELEAIDPHWALAGNAGGVAPGRLALRISDPHGQDQYIGELPARVMSLDENFIVVRRETRVSFSRDLDGFHLYGADICLNADILGWHAYVIDFHLRHLSGGNKNASFDAAEKAFRSKWQRALEPRWMQTTCTLIRLSGSTVGSITAKIAEVPYRKISRRLPKARGWKKKLTAGAAKS